MLKKLSFLTVLCTLLQISQAICSDSTQIKKPLIFVFTFGSSINEAYGSEIDYLNEKNSKYGYDKPVATNISGLNIQVSFKKFFSNYCFFRFGMGYMKKGVSMSETIYIYEDHVETNYLSLPLILGFNSTSIEDIKSDKASIYFEVGSMLNLVASDKSNNEEWRLSAESPSFSLLAGGGLRFRLSSSTALAVDYKYYNDLGASHVLKRGIYSVVPDTEFNYKFKGHIFSIGLEFSVN